MAFWYILYGIIVIFISSCADNSAEKIKGKWKVTNEERVLEFTEEGYYNVYLEGENIFKDIEGYGRLQYTTEEVNDSLYVTIVDETMENQLLKAYILVEDNTMIMNTLNDGKVSNNQEQKTVLKKLD